MQHTIKALIRKGEEQYVAECVEIAVVTQGRTIEETLANLQEAVALHLDGEGPATVGLVSVQPGTGDKTAGRITLTISSPIKGEVGTVRRGHTFKYTWSRYVGAW